MELDKTLANKLTDDYICVILISIGTVNCVKKVKLTGSVNITGEELGPLCGSCMLEQIDLKALSSFTKVQILSLHP